MVERTTEGIHSLVARILRRAPAAKLSYLSSELRLPDLVQSTVESPAESGRSGTSSLSLKP